MPVRSVLHGIRRLFRRGQADHDLTDEIDHYVEMAAREHMRRGLSRADAERAARIELGGVESVKEQVRDGGWDATIDALWRDARYAVRGLRRNPAFTIVAVLTLALGMGANTAMFSVVNAVILRPLPYRDAGRLVLIWTDDVRRGLHEEQTAWATVGDWRGGSHTLTDIGAYSVGRVTLGGVQGRERSRRAFVSGNLFAVLGANPARGRVISPPDERDGAEVAVISHALWERRFGSDSNVIGKTLVVEDAGKGSPGVFRIIGVMPPGFFFPDRLTEFWIPATTYWRFARESSEHFPDWVRRWVGVARMKPDTSLGAVRADLANVGRRLALLYPSNVPDFPGFTTRVVPILDSVTGQNLQSVLWLLLGAVSLVLLVACANAANLLLARGAARQHEFALRRALGAGRARLVRQLLVESLVLAAAGGILGVALAVVGTRVLGVVAAERLPRMEHVGIDARVLVFAASVSLLSAIVFGIGPALRVSAAREIETLKEGRTMAGGRGRRMRGLLIVAECSLTIVLLSGAGLVLRSLERLRSVDPGFDPRNVLSVRVEFPPEQPPTPDERAHPKQADQARARVREQALTDVAARVEALPGVEAVGFVDDMFISGSANTSIVIPGRSSDSTAAGELNDGSVTPGFFQALRVPLRRGRYLTRDDALTKMRALWAPLVGDFASAQNERLANAEPVVVNEAFVRRFFAAEEPIDKRFCVVPSPNKPYCYVIVGVVGDMRRQGLEHGAIPEYFGPLVPSPLARSDLLVRTHGDPRLVAPIVRQVIASVLPGALVPQVSTADRQLGEFSAQRTFQTWLLTSFAVLALVLAGVGIYGVVHYAVAERTREIGIRIALGADTPQVLRMVVIQGMRLPLLGLVIGLAAALALSRLTTRLLFGTSPLDPLTYVGVTITLGAVALGACYAPGRRAAAIEPVDALRRE